MNNEENNLNETPSPENEIPSYIADDSEEQGEEATVNVQPENVEQPIIQKKKSSKAPLIIVASILIILIAALGVVWTFFRVEAKLLFTKPSTFYQTVEKSNVSALFAAPKTQAVKTAGEPNIYKSSTKVKASIDKLPSDNPMSEQIKQMVDNTTLEYNVEEDKTLKSSKFELKGTYNKTITLSLEGITNADKSVVRVPQAGDKYIELSQSPTYTDMDKMLKDYTGRDFKALSKLFEGYYDEAVGKSVTDKNIIFNSNDKIENVACNSFTINLDKAAQADMLKRVKDKLVNDNEITEIALAFAEKSYSASALGQQATAVSKLTKEDIKKGIDELAKAIDETSAKLTDGDKLTMKIWFDDNEKIIAREISDSKIKISLFYYIHNTTISCKMSATDLKTNANYVTFDLKGKMVQKGYDFDATFEFNSLEDKDSLKVVWNNKFADKNSGSMLFTVKEADKIIGEATLTYDVVVDLLGSGSPLIGTYSLEVKDDKKTRVFNMNITTKEIEKNAKYETTIVMDGVASILLGMKEPVITLTAETTVSKLDKADIPDINSLTLIKQKDLNLEEYLGQITKNLFSVSGTANS
jgi:hypothetical protein